VRELAGCGIQGLWRSHAITYVMTWPTNRLAGPFAGTDPEALVRRS
jgi:hypothetical protein